MSPRRTAAERRASLSSALAAAVEEVKHINEERRGRGASAYFQGNRDMMVELQGAWHQLVQLVLKRNLSNQDEIVDGLIRLAATAIKGAIDTKGLINLKAAQKAAQPKAVGTSDETETEDE
jgi:hypothetical protein